MRAIPSRFLLMIAVWICVLCSGGLVSAQQTYTVEYVLVYLDECGEPFPEKISVATNIPNVGSFEAVRIAGTNAFRGKPGQSFHADGHLGSATFDGGRTNCARSFHEDADQGRYEYLAVFRLKCDRANLWSVLRIDSDAPVAVRAVRDYTENPRCSQALPLRDVPFDLKSIAWRKEVIYVHFGDTGRVPNAQYYDLLIRNGAVEKKPIQGKTSLDRRGVLEQLTVRSGRGGPNAAKIRNDFNLPREIKTVTLTVK